ncbi:MAG: hypothetical protein L0F87_10070 [Lactococcus sp.]|uniref:Uncharacterized protein n=1 Tax=Pseudolactococcus piscium MKFS47 TaxID=297352 RepID=A0A0D6DW48_9LACT|nr:MULTISPECIES: hypothetical protein [Lactococcus]MDN5410682.1 hypothetical protein [Lactococcus sp.]MDN5437202.1 hypothetical protein [Lactococcus sp.]MDN5462534.1 hypothetical protein [Lactococcus sp.]MDN5493661.1 hypothetical protein [Lactococcus sp.]MDN6106131.1 hypothetical protein [Lactococcus sp.]
MKNKNKIWIWLTIVILVILGAIGGKRYMDMKAQEKDYQDGIAIIQNYVSDYLVKNYEGIEKIEWQGIGVEYRNSPIHGGSLFGNYVDTDVKVFVTEDKYFTIHFLLTEETDYDSDLKKYVKLDSLNSQNTDVVIKGELTDAVRRSALKTDKLKFERMKKSKEGSPKTKVSYNLDIHELKY